MLSPTVRLETVWRDRDRREAQLTLHFPLSFDLGALLATANTYINLVADLSDAVLVGYKLVWRGSLDSPGDPGPTSDNTRYVGLFYRNVEELPCEALWVPSPKSTLFENAGPYAGIRVNPTAPELASVLDVSLLDNLRSAEGTLFPTVFWVGGLRL